ncbi:MAG: response regulator [Myxococcota bacterium]
MGDGLDILLVERDGRVRDLVTAFLGRAGYRIETTPDPAEAFARVRERPPSLIITEILLPKRDGLVLCRDLKADPALRAVKVVVLSMLSASARAEEAGADAFLRKPVSEPQLLDTVRRLVPDPPGGS